MAITKIKSLGITDGTIATGDIADDAVTTAKINPAQTDITSVGTLTGLTVSGDTTFTGTSYNAVWDKSDNALEFADNAKLKIGTGGDLEVYHSTNNSVIADSSSGSLFLRGSAIRIDDPNSDDYIVCTQDGSVDVYHNGSKKFETTSAGATVTGTLTATLLAGALTTADQPYIRATGITSVGTLTSATISGDLTVDSGTLKVDSSNNTVGINTASPNTNYQAHIYNAAAGAGLLVQGLGAGREAYVTLQGETSGGSTRTALFKMDNSDSIRLACAQATEWTIESGDVAGYRMKNNRQQIISYSGDTNPGNGVAILTLGYNLGNNKGGLYMPTYSYYDDIRFNVTNNDTNNGRQHDDIVFFRNGSRHGGIRIIGNSGVAYQSISDYREKTDEKTIDDAIGTVKKLKPYNFKWKKSGIRQDGFFAHEVDEVLDYAVSGKKDATKTYEGAVLNKEGNMIASGVLKEDYEKRLIDGEDDEASPKGETTYPENSNWKATYKDIDPQQMDPAKLVPILTAALQEAIKRIEVLESK